MGLYSVIPNPNILFHSPLRALRLRLLATILCIGVRTRVVMRSSSHLVQVLGWWRGREAGPGRGWRGWAACCWSRCGVTAAAGGLLGLLTAHMYVCGAGLDCTIHHTCSCAQVAAAAVIHTAKIEIISLLRSFQRLLCVSYT